MDGPDPSLAEPAVAYGAIEIGENIVGKCATSERRDTGPAALRPAKPLAAAMFAGLSARYMSLRVAGPPCGGRPGDVSAEAIRKRRAGSRRVPADAPTGFPV